MICANCGYANRDGARFCKQCGASLAIVEPSLDGVSEADALAAEDTRPSMRVANEVMARAAQADETLPIASRPTAQVDDTLVTVPGGADVIGQQPIGQKIDAAQDVTAANAAVDETTQPTVIEAMILPMTIAGHYELTEIVERTDQTIVYRAFDRMACGQCGARRTDLTDAYCWQCGAEIGRGAPRRAQVGDIPADAPQENLVIENEVPYWITPEPIEPSAQTPVRQGVYLRAGYASHHGMVREVDEDSLLIVTGVGLVEGTAQPNVGVFAVADGMGGHDNGQVASRRVIQVLAEQLVPGLLSPALSGEKILAETPEEKVCQAIQEANLRLTTEARAANSDMGSTLTLAFVHDGAAIIANVGDSRTYLWHGGVLRQITQDHSMVARLVAKGIIQPDEIYTHPRRSEIYRVMGDKPQLEVDIFPCDLQPGDRLVLCCDGAWEMIRTEGIEEVLLTYPDDPQAACDEIVKRSNAAGGEDNISVIVVDVR